MRLAKIRKGRVKNIIVGEQKDYPKYINVDSTQCGIGWLANNDGTYTNDIVTIEPVNTKKDVENLLKQAIALLKTI